MPFLFAASYAAPPAEPTPHPLETRVSGHNKWSKIAAKKGANDAKRSALWTKIIRELTVSARMGGGDPSGNPRLRLAVQAAKGAQMPSDNIERAIKRGTGELEGVEYLEMRFEGYGPSGSAFVVECLSDNKNRATAEIRHLFSKYGGNMGTTGSVGHLFTRRAVVEIEEKAPIDEDTLLEKLLEIDGFEDVEIDGPYATIYGAFEKLSPLSDGVRAKGLNVTKAEAAWVPTLRAPLEGKAAETALKLVEMLEEHDDVQHVYHNLEIDEAELERIAGG